MSMIDQDEPQQPSEIEIALRKMRGNIVPDLSVSVIAAHVDYLAMSLRKWKGECERLRADRDQLAEACQRISAASFGVALGDLNFVRDAIRKSGLEPLLSPFDHPDHHAAKAEGK